MGETVASDWRSLLGSAAPAEIPLLLTSTNLTSSLTILDFLIKLKNEMLEIYQDGDSILGQGLISEQQKNQYSGAILQVKSSFSKNLTIQTEDMKHIRSMLETLLLYYERKIKASVAYTDLEKSTLDARIQQLDPQRSILALRDPQVERSKDALELLGSDVSRNGKLFKAVNTLKTEIDTIMMRSAVPTMQRM